MASLRARAAAAYAAAFEGTRSAYPLAIFRVAFFAGLALHFFPALLWLDDGYSRGSLRSQEWSRWAFRIFPTLPHAGVRAMSVVTMVSCVAALLGLAPRASAIVAGVGLYAFASFNALRLQTLALLDAWAILLLWMICGGGDAALSVRSLFRPAPGEPREPKLLPSLILYQVLLAVFFAGVEKLLAGWPFSNEMGILLSYPRGYLVRDWVAASGWLHGPAITTGMTWFTLLVELGTPALLLVRRTRVVALVVYEAFFLGIVAMLEVPPLFYCVFAFGGLLALDDEEVGRARAWLARRIERRRPPSGTA